MARRRGDPWLVLLTLSLGFFMTLLDLTIVNIAVPDLMGDLRTGLDDVLWVINIYVLLMAVLLITAGRLGDRYGPRALFVAGVAVFTVASLACGLAGSTGMLVAARAVQGAGAALLMPQTLILIIRTFPAERWGTALGIWGSVAGVATVAGPTLGGVLVTAYGWRSIFFVNLPLGVVVLVLSVLVLPDLRQGAAVRLDPAGVVLASGFLGCLVFALIEGERYGWGRVRGVVSIPLLFAVSAVLLVAFLLQQRARQDRDPLVPFALFRHRDYTVMAVAAFGVSVGMTGMFLPFTLYLQSVLGFSPLKAGLTTVPLALVSAVTAPLAGRLVARVGGRRLLVSGLVLYAGGVLWTLLVAGTDSSWQVFVPGGVLSGFGLGLTFSPMTMIAMRGLDLGLLGSASGMTNTVRQLGSAVGTGAIGALLQYRLVVSLREETAARAGSLPPDARPAFAEALRLLSGGERAEGVYAGQAFEVFRHAYVRAMAPILLLSALILLASAAVVFVSRPVAEPASGAQETVPTGDH